MTVGTDEEALSAAARTIFMARYRPEAFPCGAPHIAATVCEVFELSEDALGDQQT